MRDTHTHTHTKHHTNTPDVETMNPGPGPGEQDSLPQGAPSSSSATSLPPISTFYDFTTSDTVSEPEPRSTTQHTYLPPIASDQASFSTWITPANTAELADQDLLDDENNNNNNNNANADYDDDTNFVYEHGRRYHANADGRVIYPLPNDESEQERDDMKHKLALWMMHDKLFYAPVEDALTRGGMVIDLGEPCLFPLLLFLGRNETRQKSHLFASPPPPHTTTLASSSGHSPPSHLLNGFAPPLVLLTVI